MRGGYRLSLRRVEIPCKQVTALFTIYIVYHFFIICKDYFRLSFKYIFLYWTNESSEMLKQVQHDVKEGDILIL